jgi:IS5 family transposase
VIYRRSAIDPSVGHMKMDGRVGRNPLKGALDDTLHSVMCGAGHQLRMIMGKLRPFCARIGIVSQAMLTS